MALNLESGKSANGIHRLVERGHVNIVLVEGVGFCNKHQGFLKGVQEKSQALRAAHKTNKFKVANEVKVV